MRISDWSSDVCSSDLHRAGTANPFAAGTAERQCRIDLVLDLDQRIEHHRPALVHVHLVGVHARILAGVRLVAIDLESLDVLGPGRCLVHLACRSEEHTSELQSLMRISYAVFCLKK